MVSIHMYAIYTVKCAVYFRRANTCIITFLYQYDTIAAPLQISFNIALYFVVYHVMSRVYDGRLSYIFAYSIYFHVNVVYYYL